MFKNTVIAILGTLLVLQHPAYATHRDILTFLSIALVLFYMIAIIEHAIEQRKKAREWLNKFMKQVENIHLPQDRRRA